MKRCRADPKSLVATEACNHEEQAPPGEADDVDGANSSDELHTPPRVDFVLRVVADLRLDDHLDWFFSLNLERSKKIVEHTLPVAKVELGLS